ncbi:CGNR zinc finger domain-containing protein [Paractinoplanes lichenicola]|uniref:CGNR zinc finger domain-containing protein n=1 Tax=Paractinoplanes lichenicola TaxID=2802976 RepID=A0ABS1W0L5_9ACTN|nr:CGNR zinc finger domain-containing protein [Actinoplanes lichenicola]MBL7260280.1 CGNR zinc finger domain-containing protein [Actinoplanes lichenicola]
MSTGVSMAAPDRLELVRRFVNTLDVEDGIDAIGDAEGLSSWLSSAGLELGLPPGDDELRRAHELREALRTAALGHHDGSALPFAVTTVLDDFARRAAVSISFTPEGGWRATAGAQGVDGALGEIVLRVVDSMTAGTWPRLKICARDSCRWAFYDTSRAGTGKWCSMRLCGNRAKQEAWRDRRRTPGQDG